MRYLSVCSGIESATVAWHPLGWAAQAYAEVEPFPAYLLHEHYQSGRPRFMPDPDAPDLSLEDRGDRSAAIKAVAALPEQTNGVPNFGDMTQFKEWPDATIDVLVGGTPCQSFSVAGLRQGLADPRGNLCLTYLAIADRYRPEWMVWENVPGVLSSNGGRDFGAFLGGLGKLGYGFAYRVLDAQYVRVDGFGRAVPQRRRRVFVVGNLTDWRRSAAVLFERSSLSWDFAPSRKAGKDIAPTISARPSGGGGLGTDFDLDGGLVTSTGDISHCLNGGGMGRQDYETETMVAHPLLAKANSSHDDSMETYVAHTLKGGGFDASEDGTGRGTPIIPFQTRGSNIDLGEVPGTIGSNADRASGSAPMIAFDTTQITSKANRSVPRSGDPRHPLAAAAHPPSIAFGIQAGALRENPDSGPDSGPDGVGIQSDHAYTLEARAEVQAVAYDLRGREGGAQFEGPHDTANIRAASGGSSRSYVAQSWAVRRLMPIECERLMGFPDGYTNVMHRGKRAADGPRYRALGNSFAVNVIRWIGRRIQMVDDVVKEIGA